MGEHIKVGEPTVRALLELRVLVASDRVGLEVWGQDSSGYPSGSEVVWLPLEHKDRLLRAVTAFGEEMGMGRD